MVFAVGEIGLSFSEFWELSPFEFSIIRKGYNQKLEREYIHEWERTRFLGSLIVNSAPNFGKTKRKFIKPEELVKLPNDKNLSESIKPESMIEQLRREGKIQ